MLSQSADTGAVVWPRELDWPELRDGPRYVRLWRQFKASEDEIPPFF